jgi:hypothetical protein
MNFTGTATNIISDQSAEMQTGKLHDYLAWFLAGVLIVSLMLIFI